MACPWTKIDDRIEEKRVWTILCIDDEELGLEVRKMVLEREGYAVLTAPDGLTGLSLFDSQNIDAVILDYAMPGQDGGRIAAAIREKKPGIPILMLSAYVSLPAKVMQSVDVLTAKGDGALSLVVTLKALLKSRSGR